MSLSMSSIGTRCSEGPGKRDTVSLDEKFLRKRRPVVLQLAEYDELYFATWSGGICAQNSFVYALKNLTFVIMSYSSHRLSNIAKLGRRVDIRAMPAMKQTAKFESGVLKHGVGNTTSSMATSADSADRRDPFYIFEDKINALDVQLQELSGEVRQLASSVGIHTAASSLRGQLRPVLHIFQRNAAHLFPQKIKDITHSIPAKRGSNANTLMKKHHARQYIHLGLANPVDIQSGNQPELLLELSVFAQTVTALLQCFNQFPEFLDEMPDGWDAIGEAAAEDLRRWSSMLSQGLADETSSQAFQLYLYSCMADIGTVLDHITDQLIPMFVCCGIPIIHTSQQHSVNNLSNLCTIATLFSSVTATMLAYSFNARTTGLSDAVNIFWFISLIFSISAAVDGMLALSWFQSVFRSPDHRVPWWVKVWMNHSPPAFLVLSVICFSVGLILLSYLSESKVTSAITTALSSVCSFGLAAMSFWFAGELWAYNHFEGRIWSADVWAIAWDELKNLSFQSLLGIFLKYSPRRSARKVTTDDRFVDAEKQTRIGFRRLHDDAKMEPDSPFWLTCDKSLMNKHEIARHRWHEAVRRINEMHQLRKREVILSLAEAPNYAKKLERMEVAYELSAEKAHKALVRVLEFSPDGRSLVTSSWDRKSFILDVQSEELACLDTIIHPSEPDRGFVHQLEWSPDGNRLLMRQNRCVSSWGGWKQGSAYRLFTSQPSDSEHTVRSVGWYRDGEGYLSAEGGRIVSITGTHQESLSSVSHRIENSVVRDFAVTKDLQWMLCVGQHPTDDDKLLRKKYQIALCSLRSYKVVSRAPVYREMSSITLADNDRSALVSYEDKAPPQLWEMNIVMLNLVLRHIFTTPNNHTPNTAFASLPSIFGGTHDQFVLRAGLAGDIFVWMRDTATLVHTIQFPDTLGHLTAFSWNRGAADDWMLATGTLEGTVQIWKVRPENVASTSQEHSDTQVAVGGDGVDAEAVESRSPHAKSDLSEVVSGTTSGSERASSLVRRRSL